jgi:hypothetical protein
MAPENIWGHTSFVARSPSKPAVLSHPADSFRPVPEGLEVARFRRDHDRQMIRNALHKGLDLVDSKPGRGHKVEVAAEDLVAKVGSAIAECEVVAVLLNVTA